MSSATQHAMLRERSVSALHLIPSSLLCAEYSVTLKKKQKKSVLNYVFHTTLKVIRNEKYTVTALHPIIKLGRKTLKGLFVMGFCGKECN